jgi:hypothetical protein
MLITVLPTRDVPSPESEHFDSRTADALPVDFDDAFARTWDSDAHFTAYEPVCPPELGGVAVRLASGVFEDGLTVRMVALVGDLDDVDAHREKRPASEAWRAEQRPRLQASGLASYATRGGYRVMAVLKEPAELSSADDARAWRSTYLGWCSELQRKHGLQLDVACADWTRLFRLPCVLRDGVQVTARLEGSGFPIVDAFAIEAAAAVTTSTATASADDRDLTDRERSDLDAAVSVLAEHFEMGKRNSLALAIGGWLRTVGLPPSAAEHLVSQLPSDAPEKRIADALKAWDKPGLVEGWAALRRFLPAEALGALQAINVGPSARKGALERVAERHEALARKKEQAAEVAKVAADAAADEPPGRALSFTDPEEPIAYLCKGLSLAPSTGKITLIAGEPGGGKGPVADHLGVCFALGLKAFEEYQCERVNVALIDVEGARLTMRRLRRLARGMNRPAAELAGKLHVFDASGEDFLSEVFHERLRRYVTRHAIGVVVLDSYTSAMLGCGVEANQPEFAVLAKELGKMGVLVIAVAHSNKSAAQRGGEPRLSDIAYSGALAAMAQTAIVVHYPTPDRNVIQVSCARAPEESFRPFRVRFEDTRGSYSDPDSGLRCAVTEDTAAPSESEPDGVELYKTRVLEDLRSAATPLPERTLVKNVSGCAEKHKAGVLRSMADDGLLLCTTSAAAGAKDGTKLHRTYTLAPATARNFEKRAKLA